MVDLFAGPGGLGEGFASLEEEGHVPYQIGISVENEASAHRTLTLRAFCWYAKHDGVHGKGGETDIQPEEDLPGAG